MYIPEIYKETDHSKVISFIRNNNFGILINSFNNRPWGTHIPFILSERNDRLYLTAHLSKANEQSMHFGKEDVLVIFNGPHAYISSSWYDHENVPTWNYSAIHVYGKVRTLTTKELYSAVDELVQNHEQHQKEPISFNELSEETLKEMNGIMGIEIEVSEVQAVRKMSQNRDDHNYHRIIDELESHSTPMEQQVATEMKKDRSN